MLSKFVYPFQLLLRNIFGPFRASFMMSTELHSRVGCEFDSSQDSDPPGRAINPQLRLNSTSRFNCAALSGDYEQSSCVVSSFVIMNSFGPVQSPPRLIRIIADTTYIIHNTVLFVHAALLCCPCSLRPFLRCIFVIFSSVIHNLSLARV